MLAPAEPNPLLILSNLKTGLWVWAVAAAAVDDGSSRPGAGPGARVSTSRVTAAGPFKFTGGWPGPAMITSLRPQLGAAVPVARGSGSHCRAPGSGLAGSGRLRPMAVTVSLSDGAP
jgi:hypothetical protein